MIIINRTIAVLIILSLNAGLCHAQANSAEPGAVLNSSVQAKEYQRLQQDFQSKKDTDEPNVVDKQPKTPLPTGKQDQMKFTVSKIITNKSDILSESEIRTVTSQYEGQKIGISDLTEVVKKINKLYADKRYITAKAVLPPQKIEHGIVHIRLIEGRIGEIILEGNQHTDKNFIVERLSFKKGDLVNLDTLEQQLSYFNKTNDIQLRAELKAGKQFGTTDCILKVIEPKNEQAVLFSDNAGNSDTGKYRGGLTWQNSSLSGKRDSLAITALGAKGTLAGSIAYNLPIDNKGTRLGISYDKNQTNVIAGPFESLDIKGNVYDAALTLSRPVIVKTNFKADAFLELHAKKSNTYFSDAELLNTDVRTLIAGYATQLVEKNSLLYIRHDLTTGSKSFGGDKEFYKYNISVVRQKQLSGDRLLMLRAAGQFAIGQNLPSSEQFSLGGMNTVRGYSESLITGDKGYLLSAELQFPISGSAKIKGLAFIDHGGSFPYKGNGETVDHEDFLTSIGVGTIINFSKATSGRIIIGIPLGHRSDYSQDARVHFFLQSMIK